MKPDKPKIKQSCLSNEIGRQGVERKETFEDRKSSNRERGWYDN